MWFVGKNCALSLWQAMRCCEAEPVRGGSCCDSWTDLASQLDYLSDSDLQASWSETTESAVQRRCLSSQELAEMTGILHGMEQSFARETIQAQLRMLLDRISKTPTDDRPIQPLRGMDGPSVTGGNSNCQLDSATGRNSTFQHGVGEYCLTRTGRYDLRPGDHVRIHALSGRPELNGCAGVVVAPAFDQESGRCCVRVDLTLIGVVRVRPAHLKLVLYAWDEAAVQFVRPSGALTSTTVGWCRTNGFDEVRPGEHGEQPVYAGPWWEEMEAVDQARALAHVALTVDDAEGGGEEGGEEGGEAGGLGGGDVHDEFLKGLSAGCVGMEIDAAEGGLASLETHDFETDDADDDGDDDDDDDDDFADLAHFEEITDVGFGMGLAEDSPKSVAAEDFGYSYAGRAFEQLGGEWSFSPDDLDSLARLGAMHQPLPVG